MGSKFKARISETVLLLILFLLLFLLLRYLLMRHFDEPIKPKKNFSLHVSSAFANSGALQAVKMP